MYFLLMNLRCWIMNVAFYDATTPDDWEKDIKKFTEIYGNYSDLEKNYGNRKGLDWQDETLGRTAITQNYRVGVSGGTDKLNYNLAYSYYDEEGAMYIAATTSTTFHST